MTKTHSLHPLEPAIARNLLIVSAESYLHDAVKLINQSQHQASFLSEQSVKGAKFSGNGVSCVLVVAESQLVGILTQSDLLRLMLMDLDPSKTKVSDVMTQPVVTLRQSEVQDVAIPLNLLRQHHLSYLPLLDEQDYPIGLITLKGLLQIDDLTIQSSQQSQTQQLKNESLLTAIANHIQASLDLQTILDTTVSEIRQFLQTDRVIAYQFEPDWSGIVVAESVLPRWESLLGKTISDPYFQKHMVEPYKNGRIQVTDNVYLGELTWCHMNLLIQIQVKAIVVVPILNGDRLWGLLAAQECDQSRHWEPSAVELLQQLATHIGIAIQQASMMSQLQQLNQKLEDRITERTTALAKSENRLNLIVSNVSDGILIVDREGKIVFANPSAGKLFNMPVEQLVGLTIGIPNVLNSLFEINHLTQDGRIGGSEMQVVLIEWNDHPAYLISLHDITERQQAETKLQQTNQELARATRLKDEFLANMSHELRTPLNAILGMTEGLQEGVFGAINEKQIKALQTVELSGYHLLELINDILDVAKIEAGRIELEYTSVSAAHLCQSSLAFIKQQALKKRIHLEMNLPLNLPDLLVDERRILQVLINLLNNAVKFTPENGRITLEAARFPRSPDTLTDYLQIAVIDTGIGITPENIQKLFQPFIQIDSALNRQYEGTGLGLALVKRIVELHGGKVELTSELGVGSCFAIELPCNPNSPLATAIMESNQLTTSSAANSSPVNTDTGYILIAEDNEANISTVSSYLKAKGYRILSAINGLEAIALAKSHQPDLILMDIQMPVMDGLEATKQIRQNPELANIPIVALTALAMTGDRERCLEAGANEYLTKPIKLKQLSQTIQSLLAPQKRCP